MRRSQTRPIPCYVRIRPRSTEFFPIVLCRDILVIYSPKEEGTLGAVVADDWPPPSTDEDADDIGPDVWLLDDDSVYEEYVEAAMRNWQRKVAVRQRENERTARHILAKRDHGVPESKLAKLETIVEDDRQDYFFYRNTSLAYYIGSAVLFFGVAQMLTIFLFDNSGILPDTYRDISGINGDVISQYTRTVEDPSPAVVFGNPEPRGQEAKGLVGNKPIGGVLSGEE